MKKLLVIFFIFSIFWGTAVFADASETRVGIVARMGQIQTDSTDLESGGKAKLVSDSDIGGTFFVDHRGKHRTLFELGANRITINVPAGKTIQNNPPSLVLGRFGYGFHPSARLKNMWVTIVGGYEQIVFYRGIDFTTIRADQVGLPTLGVRWAFDFLTGEKFGFEAELGVEGIAPMSGQYETIKYGYSALGRIIFARKFGKKFRVGLGGEAWYRMLHSETMNQSVTDLRGSLSLSFVL